MNDPGVEHYGDQSVTGSLLGTGFVPGLEQDIKSQDRTQSSGPHGAWQPGWKNEVISHRRQLEEL